MLTVSGSNAARCTGVSRLQKGPWSVATTRIMFLLQPLSVACFAECQRLAMYWRQFAGIHTQLAKG